MKKFIAIATVALALVSGNLAAQKYFTRTGHINFFSTTKMEDIKADNHKANVVLDASTGALEISCLIKAFEFEKALMQEHFNENYMQSDTYPKATFKGKIENMSAINLKKDGTYSAKVTGDLTMHGVTKKITVDATFKVASGKITTECKFPVNVNDYNITIPGNNKDQVSEKIDLTVKCTLEELKK